MSMVEDLKNELDVIRAELEQWGLITNQRVLMLENRDRQISLELAQIARDNLYERQQALLREKMAAEMDKAREELNAAHDYKLQIQNALDAGLIVHFYNTGVTLEDRPNDTRIDYYKGATLEEAWVKWFNGDPFLSDELQCIEEEPDVVVDEFYLRPTDNTPLSEILPDNAPLSALRLQPLWIYTKKTTQYAKRQSRIVRFFSWIGRGIVFVLKEGKMSS